MTQAFNTTTSMGRLTLNVLLSFAQFEREVTGERIRDKIAASKAKGIWMGGNLPLGYDVKDRALVINPAEAETVRFIFRRFLELGSVHGLMRDLGSRGVRSKERRHADGTSFGGRPYFRGALYWLLGNPVYRGLVAHRGQTYAGQHQAIVDQELWDQVQALRAQIANKRRMHHKSDALFVGRVFDDRGNAMTPTYTKNEGRRYRYYVSSALNRGRPEMAGSQKRVAMAILDKAAVDAVKPLLRSNWEADVSDSLRAREAIIRIELAPDSLTLDLKPEALKDIAGGRDAAAPVRITHPIKLARPRNSTTLIQADTNTRRADRALIRAVAMANAWMRRLDSGLVKSITALAEADNLCPAHTARLLPLAYLAPDLVDQILEGRQPQTLTLRALTAEPLPLDWREQRARFREFL